ncbi:tyrosine-type recombinase/integrase [Xylanimonas ulmi]|uniref:tyrosine-type recombinase/integrase n=1 Tax=Xylanimonas ulmi TaxID=228973 RepID=UPI00102AF589
MGSHMLRPKPPTPLPPYSGGWFESAVRRPSIPRGTPHDLRHAAASLAVSAGASVNAVQKLVGHKFAAMTLVADQLHSARRQAFDQGCVTLSRCARRQRFWRPSEPPTCFAFCAVCQRSLKTDPLRVPEN